MVVLVDGIDLVLIASGRIVFSYDGRRRVLRFGLLEREYEKEKCFKRGERLFMQCRLY